MSTLTLLKGPLLVCHAIGTYRGMSPPTRTPLSKERQRAAIPDFLASASSVQRVAFATAKIIFCAVALSEATTLVVHQMPQTWPVPRLLASLLPFSPPNGDGSSYPLRLTAVSSIGCGLGIVGGFIRVWCHRTLGRFFTWEVAVRDDHKLITAGPYSIVRHPSYTGWISITVGNLLLLYGRGSFFREAGLWETLAGKAVAVFATVCTGWVCAGMLYRTHTEDLMMKKEFGTEWEEWAKSTRYRLIPYVY
ncbi:ICMT-domain-containing protein [Daedaleopsis nitida]|nr:ICMT-domain-containing protein [Daedaleopsis nitida]